MRAHAVRIGQRVTQANFTPGYLVVRFRGAQQGKLGLHVVSWRTLAEALDIRAGKQTGPVAYQRFVRLYGDAREEWSRSGRGEPLVRVA